ncbi:MAG: hypothetical protein J5I90_07065 [Caldilineales bacterium]|nr:hypothetical protein [Caldilineales bacterium]
MRLLATDPIVYLLVLGGLLLSLGLGFVTQQAAMMPIINAIVLWPLLIWSFRRARIDVALRLILFWGLTIYLVTIVAGRVNLSWAQGAVPGSLDFNASHIMWLTGSESFTPQPEFWLAEQAKRTGILLAGSVISAGLIPLVVAARELAILGLWTANLFDAPSFLAPIVGTPPWILAEIIAWVGLGTPLAEPIVTGDVQSLLTRQRRRFLVIGAVALVLSVAFHWALPGVVQAIMRPLVVIP